MTKSSIPSLHPLPTADIKFPPPMLALAVSALPEGQDWQYEIKLDGYRAIVVKTGHVTVLSDGAMTSATDSERLPRH